MDWPAAHRSAPPGLAPHGFARAVPILYSTSARDDRDYLGLHDCQNTRLCWLSRNSMGFDFQQKKIPPGIAWNARGEMRAPGAMGLSLHVLRFLRKPVTQRIQRAHPRDQRLMLRLRLTPPVPGIVSSNPQCHPQESRPYSHGLRLLPHPWVSGRLCF